LQKFEQLYYYDFVLIYFQKLCFLKVHSLKRSLSNTNWFVWPELSGNQPDIAWIDEGNYMLILAY